MYIELKQISCIKIINNNNNIEWNCESNYIDLNESQVCIDSGIPEKQN